MKYKTSLTLVSIIINLSLILAIILRSPSEQSLQENVTSFQFFESSSKAAHYLDKIITIFTSCYFLVGLLFTISRSF